MSASNPEIVSVDGTHSHDAREILDWQLDCIDGGNPTGTLEFNIAQKTRARSSPSRSALDPSPSTTAYQQRREHGATGPSATRRQEVTG